VKRQNKTLKKLFAEHSGKVTDKWSIYISEYDRLFQPYRNRSVNLLEIGIQNGGSLEIWAKYFPKAKIILGCDINPDCAQLEFDDPRIALVVADANTDETQQELLQLSSEFDLVIDDGSHHSGDIVRSFARYFPYLNDGGLYIAEDLHCSYWQDFEGGLFQPYSSMAFFKQLADTINYEHWGIDKTRTELLRSFNQHYSTLLDEVALAHIHSIEFINSICVIRKAKRADNILGSRFIAGSIALVDEEPLPLHGKSSSNNDQTANEWSARDDTVVEELMSRIQEMNRLRQLTVQLDIKITEKDQQFSQSEKIFSLQLQAEQQKLHRLEQEWSRREQEVTAQLLSIEQLASVEKTMLSQQYRSDLHALQAKHAELTHSQEITLVDARKQIETQLLQKIERERELSIQLLAIQQSCELKKESQRREHTELVRKLNAELVDKHGELVCLITNRNETEKIMMYALTDLDRQIDLMRNTYSWRWTSPLRGLAKWASKNSSDNFKVTQAILDNTQENYCATRKAIQISEALIPLSASPNNKNIRIFDMSLNDINIPATTFDELLSHNDIEFIHNAYITLLGREPDSDGMQYYLSRLRNGISKLEILSQLRMSTEAKSRQAHVVGLGKAIKLHKQFKNPFLGSLLRLCGAKQPENSGPQIMRAIENKIYLLDVQLQKRFMALDDLINKLSIGSGVKPSNIKKPHQFDEKWYLEQNPDVKKSGINALEHYMNYGVVEGRAPAFDGEWYLINYPDVAKSGMNPLEHYKKYGKAEGRHPAFDRNWYLNSYSDVSASGIDPLDHYFKFGKAEGRQPANSHLSNVGSNDYFKWVMEFDTLNSSERNEMLKRIAQHKNKPLISIVMPVYNPKPEWLEEAIKSVRSQIYSNWELCIADDASTNPSIRTILETYAREDDRIHVVFRKENGHISAASNSALSLAKGEWVALLDHDDLLADHALYWVADAINKSPNSRLFYSDEDKIDESGVRSGPYFKCDWNEDLFYSHNLITHLGIYQSELLRKIGGFRLGYEGSQDYDLALRCIEHIDQDQIHHIPRVLYHWRVHDESTAMSSDAKPYAMIAGERAINEHLLRKGVDATAELIGYGYRVRYALPQVLPLVSLIIPTRNGLSFLKVCIDSIMQKTTYSNYEILIVDNGSDELACLNYLKTIVSNPNITVVRDEQPFNYSALNNAAVKAARGEIIGLINNDIEVISPDWLSEMVSHVLRPEVGAVGARLWYSNDTLQHGGVILGLGGVVAHSHRTLPKGNPGYCGRASLIQSFSAVTAACLLIRKSIYEELGGLNEAELKVAYNDVDFCLRVREAGYRNIWTPYAELYHHESATRGPDDTLEKVVRFDSEKEYMITRWKGLLANDPAYSPNLTLNHEDFSLAWPPRVEMLIG
jgi:glycosyltransferase involved in cell wall biosynthesis